MTSKCTVREHASSGAVNHSLSSAKYPGTHDGYIARHSQKLERI